MKPNIKFNSLILILGFTNLIQPTAHNNWAQENPNSAQVFQLSTNVLTTATGVKVNSLKGMGRGNDDFGTATTNHADDAFARAGDYDLGNVYDRQKQQDLKPSQQNNNHNQKAGGAPVFSNYAGNDKRTSQNTQSNTKPNTTTSNPLGGVAVGVNANLQKQTMGNSGSPTTTGNTSPMDGGGVGDSTYSNTSQNHHTPLAGAYPTQHGSGTWQNSNHNQPNTNNSQNARGASGFPIYTNNGKITQQTQSNTITSALLTTTAVGVNVNGARQVGQPTQLGAQTVADTTQNRHLEQERQALARIKENYSDTERKNNLDYRYKPANSTLQLRDFQNQVREARKTAPSDSKKSGNVAVARIDIEGLDIKQMAGHSRLDKPKGDFIGEGKTVFHYETIKTLDNRNLPRNTDSEYKILSNLADKLGSNYQAQGNVTIFTEKAACSSCKGVVDQFMKLYPNIRVNIIHNKGERLKPQSQGKQ